MTNTSIITINNLTAKNRKVVDKNCVSTDYYFGDKFLFNEVSFSTKNGKSVDYQYFTNLQLTRLAANELAQKINAQTFSNYDGHSIYFNDFNKALEFINSEDFN